MQMRAVLRRAGNRSRRQHRVLVLVVLAAVCLGGAAAACSGESGPDDPRRAGLVRQAITDSYAGTSRAWVAQAVTGVRVNGGTATVSTDWFPKDSSRENASRLCNVVATGGKRQWDLDRVIIRGQSSAPLASCSAT